MIFDEHWLILVDFPLADHLKSNMIRGLICHTWSYKGQSLFLEILEFFIEQISMFSLVGISNKAGGPKKLPALYLFYKGFIRRQGGIWGQFILKVHLGAIRRESILKVLLNKTHL